MTDKFKLAIIGCGGHARGTLAPLWKDIPEIEPVAACDAHAESLANFAELFGIENTYSDAQKMLAEQQPDILIVGSWPASHMQNVLDGVRGGCRGIFCEKPIALSAGETERMFQAAEDAGVILVEGFMHLYHPQTHAVKARLDEGAVGELRCIRASFSSGSSNPTNWRRRGELGGGAAMDLGCYCLSSIRYLVGTDPLWVSANGNFDADAEIWHTLLGTLHFDNGVIGQFDCSFGWPRRGDLRSGRHRRHHLGAAHRLVVAQGRIVDLHMGERRLSRSAGRDGRSAGTESLPRGTPRPVQRLGDRRTDASTGRTIRGNHASHRRGPRVRAHGSAGRDRLVTRAATNG